MNTNKPMLLAFTLLSFGQVSANAQNANSPCTEAAPLEAAIANVRARLESDEVKRNPALVPSLRQNLSITEAKAKPLIAACNAQKAAAKAAADAKAKADADAKAKADAAAQAKAKADGEAKAKADADAKAKMDATRLYILEQRMKNPGTPSHETFSMAGLAAQAKDQRELACLSAPKLEKEVVDAEAVVATKKAAVAAAKARCAR